LNHSYLRVLSDDTGKVEELREFLTFEVPGAKFSPKFKKYNHKTGRVEGHWDGKMRLLTAKQLAPTGLRHVIHEWAEDVGYEVQDHKFPEAPPLLVEGGDFEAWLASMSGKYHPRPYQVKAVQDALGLTRATLLSSTGSGKTLLLYYLASILPKPVLVIVPNVGLVHQFDQDFFDYGWNLPTQLIYADQEKAIPPTGKVVSTWQSLAPQPKEWFEPFKTVLVDEVHHAKAKVLSDIMKSLPHVGFRFGVTGTLDDIQQNRLTIQGHFGKIVEVAKTRDLIDAGYNADLRIKGLLLKYPKDITKRFRGVEYAAEVDWLCGNPRRNRFVGDLAKSFKGNTLLLTRYVEKHAEPLYAAIAKNASCPVYLVVGKVEAEEREAIRKIVSTHERSIIVASEGTMGEGVNMPSLNDIILATPSKSRIQLMQKIGRGTRLAEGKTHCNIWDLADDLSPHKKTMNFTYKHYMQRVRYYLEEKLEFEQQKVDLYDLYK
jgi:Kyanoviridae DNA helicase